MERGIRVSEDNPIDDLLDVQTILRRNCTRQGSGGPEPVGPPETLEAAKHFLFNERDGTQQAERLAQTDIHTWKETSIQPRDMDRQQDMNAVQAMNMIIDQVGHSHRTTTNGVSYFPFLSPITIFLYPAAMSRTSTPKPIYGWLQ